LCGHKNGLLSGFCVISWAGTLEGLWHAKYEIDVFCVYEGGDKVKKG